MAAQLIETKGRPRRGLYPGQQLRERCLLPGGLSSPVTSTVVSERGGPLCIGLGTCRIASLGPNPHGLDAP